MDFRKVAGDIVLGLNDEKWQATETKIVDALDSAYRLGFLDGEASVKPSHSCEDFTLRGVLRALLRLPAGWDRRGARPIQVDAIVAVAEVLLRTMPRNAPVPAIIPVSDGGIQVEWHQGQMDVELYVSPLGALTVYVHDRIAVTEVESATEVAPRLRDAITTLTGPDEVAGVCV